MTCICVNFDIGIIVRRLLAWWAFLDCSKLLGKGKKMLDRKRCQGHVISSEHHHFALLFFLIQRASTIGVSVCTYKSMCIGTWSGLYIQLHIVS